IRFGGRFGRGAKLLAEGRDDGLQVGAGDFRGGGSRPLRPGEGARVHESAAPRPAAPGAPPARRADAPLGRARPARRGARHAGARTGRQAMTLEEKLDRVPDRPGVYLYKDAKGQVIYIGKAASLKSRVRSYFQESRPRDPKTDALVGQIRDLDYIVTGNELEALI